MSRLEKVISFKILIVFPFYLSQLGLTFYLAEYMQVKISGLEPIY